MSVGCMHKGKLLPVCRDYCVVCPKRSGPNSNGVGELLALMSINQAQVFEGGVHTIVSACSYIPIPRRIMARFALSSANWRDPLPSSTLWMVKGLLGPNLAVWLIVSPCQCHYPILHFPGLSVSLSHEADSNQPLLEPHFGACVGPSDVDQGPANDVCHRCKLPTVHCSRNAFVDIAKARICCLGVWRWCTNDCRY